MGTAAIPSLASTDSGWVQMQQSSVSGNEERMRESTASNVLSFPVFNDPKFPKKLTFTGFPFFDS
jgi:hypothetical protein